MAVIVDYLGTGDILNAQGSLTVLKDQDALNNAINLWVASFRGERLYQPYTGGIVINNLLQPMSDRQAEAIRRDIIEGLSNQFDPSINVAKCIVFPDYDRDTYWISVEGYCPALQVSIFTKIGLKTLKN